MDIKRRDLLAASASAFAAGVMVTPAHAQPTPISALGRDVTQYGVRPNASEDQTRAIQRAIDDAARVQAPLAFPPGLYRTAMLRLPSGAHLIGVRGASKLIATDTAPIIMSEGTSAITISGLALDGKTMALPERRGLITLQQCKQARIIDCDIANAGGNGIVLQQVSGDIRNNSIRDIALSAILSFDSAGLLISQNTIQGSQNNGIEMQRTTIGDDGSIITDNRIENIKASRGGSGQYGNAIFVYRMSNVIVRGNQIRNCDYSAVRGNSSPNIQIVSNSVVDAREVALYSEFAFEGAVIANNTVDGAAIGISVTNFNNGGRIAAVQGNVIRNVLPKRPADDWPADAGIGIYVEADAAVTGNVVDTVPNVGIMAGWGPYLRDVAITGNVVRNAFIGVGVSVVQGAGTALVNNNLISATPRGAIVGLDHAKPVTGDLSVANASRYAQLVIGSNAVR